MVAPERPEIGAGIRPLRRPADDAGQPRPRRPRAAAGSSRRRPPGPPRPAAAPPPSGPAAAGPGRSPYGCAIPSSAPSGRLHLLDQALDLLVVGPQPGGPAQVVQRLRLP